MAKQSTGKARGFWAAGGEASDVRWATGFAAPDPFAMVEAGGERWLLVSALEAGRASKTARGRAKVRVLRRGEKASAAMADVARAAGAARMTVGKMFPVGIARGLEEAGMAVDVAEGAAYPERAVKTAAEVRAIAESQRAAAAAVRRAATVLRESEARGRDGGLWWEGAWLTSERLRKEMEAEIAARGGRSDDGLIAAGGRQAACPHEEGHGLLRAGEAIVLDVFPRNRRSGYWGDLTRTLMKGAPKDPRIVAMWRATLEAQRLALSMAKPGVRGEDIQAAVEEWYERAGFGLDTSVPGRERGLIHGVGHGVGLDIHEEPRISRGAGPLAAGNVVTVEPGVYDPDIGGVRIEDTVLVTERGARCLARVGRGLRV